MILRRIPIVFLVLASCASFAVGQEKFVRPVDEAKKDASFLAFRTKLIAAVERRDAKFILSIIDPQIKIGFGGDDGIAAFKRQWKLANKKSDFWQEFLAVIKNGGTFDSGGKSFTAPYTFTSWPDDVDGFEYLAIFGNGVNLRDKPSKDGRVIGSLSYNVVSVEFEASVKSSVSREEDTKFEWYKVKTLGGLSGFVKSEFVRSHIDYRASFEKQRGAWKLVFFLAGD